MSPLEPLLNNLSGLQGWKTGRQEGLCFVAGTSKPQAWTISTDWLKTQASSRQLQQEEMAQRLKKGWGAWAKRTGRRQNNNRIAIG